MLSSITHYEELTADVMARAYECARLLVEGGSVEQVLGTLHF